MFKKLQRKYVIIAISLFFVVIFSMITTAYVITFIKIDNNLEQKLNLIIENNGKMPFPDGTESGNGQNGDELSPETPYETRYFTVLLSKETDYIFVYTDNIVSITKDEAINYAKKLLSKNDLNGYLSYYKFTAVDLTNSYMYVFLDCSRELIAFNFFLWCGIIIGGIIVLIFSILVLLLSNRVIKPYIENYNKQKQFITNVNHEIKTPLAIIKASNEVIELESGKNEWTDTINSQIDKLNNLTEKLVFLSRMDEDNVHNIEMTNFDISKTAYEIASSFEVLAKTKNKDFNYEIQSDILFNGDISLISQLISILLDNAFKYSNKNGFISLKLNSNGKNITLSIKNSVDKKLEGNLNKLFERFYRDEKSRNSETGGFGIGLSFAKAITLLHKGKITAKNKENNTVEFLVVFNIL